MSGFDLVRRHVHETEALLLLEPTAEQVLDARGDGEAFALSQGILVRRGKSTASAIRLRRPFEALHLYLPVDAVLIPALTEREARDLVGQHGLVFLPGGRVLGFEPREPLDLGALIAVGNVERRAWRRLPEKPKQASRLASIKLDLPPEAEDRVIESGAPRGSPTSKEPASAADRLSLSIGRALMKAGEALDWKGLKQAGAGWIENLLSKVPSLGESVLGRQEAALRELLRELRDGNIEEALRHALPMPEPGGGRGGKVAGDANLPRHDIKYSLGNVLGHRGPASVWLGAMDIQKELAAEYRKAAEAAIAAGDHRRAAFIYGKLLRDYRAAARALAQGGLHRDAAIIFLAKCGDKRAAAAEFAAAGEVDRAVELYREEREHLLAGDLLRGTGDEEAAVVEFQKAADVLARAESWREAAAILTQRARRNDLAIALLETGWARRDRRPVIVCGVELASLYVQERKPDRLLSLVSEAEPLLSGAGREPEASLFWGTLTRLSEAESVEPALGFELRDRARLGLALKLAQRARWDPQPARVVSEVFGTHGAWSAGVWADARLAVAASRKKEKPRGREPIARIRVASGAVTAVACAPRGGIVFLGFENGEVHRFSVSDRECSKIAAKPAAITALATDPAGRFLVLAHEENEVVTYSRRLDGPYFKIATIDVGAGTVLSNVTGSDRARVVVAEGENVATYDCPALQLVRRVRLPDVEPAAILLDADRFFAFAESRAVSLKREHLLGWTPEAPEGSSLRRAPLSSVPAGEDLDGLEVAAIQGGVVAWASFPEPWSDGRPSVLFRSGSGYRAVTLVRSGVLAAVSRSSIERLEVSQSSLVQTSSTAAVAANAVACFHVEGTQEIVVVLADGVVLCAP
jgi:hypothetical protein